MPIQDGSSIQEQPIGVKMRVELYKSCEFCQIRHKLAKCDMQVFVSCCFSADFFKNSSEFGKFGFLRRLFLPKIGVFSAQYCKRLIGYFYRRIISVSTYQSVNSDSRILK